MKRKPIRATGAQIDRLLGDVKAVPAGPIGEHLTDDQFVAYSMDPPELSAEATAAIDAHLSSCEACAAQMEHLLTVSEAWRGPAGQQRLASLPKSTRQSLAGQAIARLQDFLGGLEPRMAALGAAAATPSETATDRYQVSCTSRPPAATCG